jgi:hypothetical protein
MARKKRSAPATALKTTGWGGAGSLRHTIPDGWYTRRQAAELVGRDFDTLRRWHSEGIYVSHNWVVRGKLTVWLYSDEDIENMKKIPGSARQGTAYRREQG